jgi:hypothetical protein
VPITLGRKVVSAEVAGSQLRLRLDDGTERLVDHALLATGFRVDVSRYPFLSPSLSKQLKTVNGYPVLKRGLESSIPGLHFLRQACGVEFRAAAWICFGSGVRLERIGSLHDSENGSN